MRYGDIFTSGGLGFSPRLLLQVLLVVAFMILFEKDNEKNKQLLVLSFFLLLHFYNLLCLQICWFSYRIPSLILRNIYSYQKITLWVFIFLPIMHVIFCQILAICTFQNLIQSLVCIKMVAFSALPGFLMITTFLDYLDYEKFILLADLEIIYFNYI